jgi:hypothetical protein
MEKDILIITKESVRELRKNLEHAEKIGQCKDELKRMIEIKETLMWRSEKGTCCGTLCDLIADLTWQIQILQSTLAAVEEGRTAEAASNLEDLIQLLN